MKKQAEPKKLFLEKDSQMIEFYDMVSYRLRGPLVNIAMLVKFIAECSDPAEQQLLMSKLISVTESLDSVFDELTASIHIKRNLAIKAGAVPARKLFHKNN